jgi:hypothetical protein
VGGPAERKNVRPALAGSYEAMFHAARLARFLAIWRQGDTALKDLREPRLERAIEVIYRRETERVSHYFKARLLDQLTPCSTLMKRERSNRSSVPLNGRLARCRRRSPSRYRWGGISGPNDA